MLRPLLVTVVLAAALSQCFVCPAAEGDESQHWAYRPIADPVPPEVRDGGWIRNGIVLA